MQSQVQAQAPSAAPPLAPALGKNWWLVLLRGIAAIIFGLLLVMFALRLRKQAA